MLGLALSFILGFSLGYYVAAREAAAIIQTYDAGRLQ
jgi:hypothetical protein